MAAPMLFTHAVSLAGLSLTCRYAVFFNFWAPADRAAQMLFTRSLTKALSVQMHANTTRLQLAMQ